MDKLDKIIEELAEYYGMEVIKGEKNEGVSEIISSLFDYRIIDFEDWLEF